MKHRNGRHVREFATIHGCGSVPVLNAASSLVLNAEEEPVTITPKRLSKRAKRKIAHGKGKGMRLDKLDPSRTLTLRKSFCQMLKKQFATLKGRIVKLIAGDDAFGLNDPEQVEVVNSNPEGCNQWTGPGCSTGESTEKEMTTEQLTKEYKGRYPKAGDTVDGRQVVRKIDNLGSIESSLDNFSVVPGIREVKLDAFQSIRLRRERNLGEVERRVNTAEDARVDKLAAKIKESGKLSVLIVVDDGHPDGPYVLEGGHRLDALERLGAKSLPAKVVIDLDGIKKHRNVSVVDNSSSQESYQRFVCNGQDAWFPVVDLLPVPLVKQRKSFDCGAAAVTGVLRHFGIDAKSKYVAWWLSTDELGETPPQKIIDLFDSLGLHVEARQDMTLDNLGQCLKRGMPVIVCVQKSEVRQRMVNLRNDSPNRPQLGETLVKTDARKGTSCSSAGQTHYTRNSGHEDQPRDEKGRFSNALGVAIQKYGPVLAETKQGKYVIRIHDAGKPENPQHISSESRNIEAVGTQTIEGPDGSIVKAGGWLDWAEESYPTDYNELPKSVRAKLETDHQVTAYKGLKYDFKFHKERQTEGDEIIVNTLSQEMTNGHWITIIGRESGWVFFNDPADGSRKTVKDADFLEMWDDEDFQGSRFHRFGIAVGQAGVDNANPEGCNQHTGPDCGEETTAISDKPSRKEQFKATVKRVTAIAKSTIFNKLTEIAFKAMDVWLMEQAANADHPRSVLTAKIVLTAAFKGTKLAQALKARLTGNEADDDDTVGMDQEAVLQAVVGELAAVLGLPVPSAVQLRALMRRVTENSNLEGCNQYKECGEGSDRKEFMTGLTPLAKGKSRAALEKRLTTDEGIIHVHQHVEGIAKKPGAKADTFKGKPAMGYGDGMVVPVRSASEMNYFNHLLAGGKSISEEKAEQAAAKAEQQKAPQTPEEQHQQTKELRARLSKQEEDWRATHIDNSFSQELATNAPKRRHPSSAKLEAFQEWMKGQMDELIRGKTQEAQWDAYIKQGWSKGAGRAFDDVRKPQSYAKGHARDKSTDDFYKGGKEEFLKSAFGQPVARDKVKLMASQSFDDLEGVTGEMSLRMSRILTDGLIEGKSPHEVAKDMTEQVDISRKRAEVISQHQLMKVHNEGQLTALEQLGVEEVGVAVEWLTSGMERCDDLPAKQRSGSGCVCPKCAAMEGVVLTIDEARGMLPLHVGCKCVWLPSGTGEDDEDQKSSKADIDDALAEAGLDLEVGSDRPKSILNVSHDLIELDRLLTNNATSLRKEDWLEDDDGEQHDEHSEHDDPDLTEFEQLFADNSNPEGCNQHTGPDCANNGEDEKGVSELIDAMPNAPARFGEGHARPPFPIKTDVDVGQWGESKLSGKAFVYVAGEKHEVPEAEVRVDQLTATQEFVSRKQLTAISKQTEGNLANPCVLKIGQKLYLAEGHHRASLAKLRGDATLKVWLWDGPVDNSNPEGCNQFTGPGCGEGGDEFFTVPDHYAGDAKLEGRWKAGDKISKEQFEQLTPKAKSRFVQPSKVSEKKGEALLPTPVSMVPLSGTSKTLSKQDAIKHIADVVREVADKSGLAPLHKVRDALAKRGVIDRKAQDDAIQAARGESVSASKFEGRHGSTEEERTGWLHDGDDKLGYLELRQTNNELMELRALDRLMSDNSNPEGCNQHTGPGCSGGGGTSTNGPHHRAALMTVTDSLESASHLSPEKKAAYRASVEKVIGRMSQKAAALVAANVGEVEWHGDLNALAASRVKEAAPGSINPLEKPSGTFNMNTGLLRLNGETEKRNAPGMGIGKGQALKDIAGTHAHELTHVIDRGEVHSKTEGWREAWREEIMGGKLSRYGAGAPVEGFAEFGRLLYGSEVDRGQAKEQFPKAYKYFESEGLV